MSSITTGPPALRCELETCLLSTSHTDLRVTTKQQQHHPIEWFPAPFVPSRTKCTVTFPSRTTHPITTLPPRSLLRDPPDRSAVLQSHTPCNHTPIRNQLAQYMRAVRKPQPRPTTKARYCIRTPYIETCEYVQPRQLFASMMHGLCCICPSPVAGVSYLDEETAV